MIRVLSDIAVDPVVDGIENDPALMWIIVGVVAAVAAITAVIVVTLVKKKKRSK